MFGFNIASFLIWYFKRLLLFYHLNSILQDNMESYRVNIEKLQDFLVKVFSLCKINVVLIKDELVRLKEEVDEQKNFVSTKYLEITQAWKKSCEETELRFREQTQRLTVDHELELSDMKASLNDKDDSISILKKEKEELILGHKKELERLEAEHQTTKDLLEQTREEIAAFDKKLKDFEVQKQKEFKEIQEKMHLEYKAEIESLRSRLVQIL